MARYAATTRVPVDRSRAEVQRVLRRYGATRIAEAWAPGAAAVQFEIGGLVARIEVPMPTSIQIAADLRRKRPTDAALRRAVTQAERQRWRAFVLLLKAKLESVALGVVTFEREFMPHLMLENGTTVGAAMEHALRAGETRLATPALPAKGG
jgi:hypothetical protein